MQAVSAAGRPPVDQADDDLGHEPDQALHLEDVQPPGASHVNRVRGVSACVLVAGAPANALIAAGAKRPTAVAWAGPVTSQQHHAHVGGHPGVVEHPVQLVDSVRPKGVAHLGPVERHSHGGVFDVAVIGDVGQIAEPVDKSPCLCIKWIVTQGC